MPRSRDTLLLKAKMFRGFADSSRLSVLEALRDGPKNVSEVVKTTGLSQPNVSSHLACLKECGLLKRERRGRKIYYEISHKEVTTMLEQAEQVLREMGRRIYACTRYGERRR